MIRSNFKKDGRENVCVYVHVSKWWYTHVFDWAKIQNLEKKFGHKNTSGYNFSFKWYDGGRDTPFVAKFFPFSFQTSSTYRSVYMAMR